MILKFNFISYLHFKSFNMIKYLTNNIFKYVISYNNANIHLGATLPFSRSALANWKCKII